MSTNGLVVAVVGATGAVGEEMLNVLAERNFPVSELLPLASERSAGQTIEFRGDHIEVKRLTESSFEGVDIALFSAGAGISEKFAPIAAHAGCFVVDNSRAFRMDPKVPLVVPEVNAHALESDSKIIANPNCSTIQKVVALKPLMDVSDIKRVVVSTYQSASGAGRDGMNELRDQTVDLLNFREPKSEIFSRRLAFETVPHIDIFESDGFTREEHKMIFETQKILERPGLPVCATCVRVPVFVSHAMSVNVEFESTVSLQAVTDAWKNAPGIVFNENQADFPVAADAAGNDEVHIGRLRIDPSTEHGLVFWCVADNLRKGAATNAVQIAEALHTMGKFA